MGAIKSFMQSMRLSAPQRPKVELAAIDASLRVPCLIFFTAALVWLLMGTVFALLASFTLHSPQLLPQWQWLTFGIVRSMHLNAMAFGWGNNAAFAVGLWIMARLCRTEVRHEGILVVAAIFWNLALVVGIVGIGMGNMTSVEWLEMPMFVGPLLAVSYALIGIWGVLSFRYTRSDHVYVSQWYILAALFWFPWLYMIAQVMILWFPARGTVQSITNWWFAHNALGLWFTPIGLAASYYFIPKVLGRPISSYYLSVLGFWSLALFYNWAGVHHLIGGPIPVWLISAGIVGSVMMVIPVIVTGINLHMTVVGFFGEVWKSPTLRFVVFGAMSYTVASLIGSAMALPEVNVVSHFTHMTVGHAHHGVYAFFTMVMFGSIYFMMPRLVKREWPSAFLIRLHFWCAVLGITLMIVALHIGGWIQGLEMNNPEILFLDLMKNTIPWLQARSVSGILLAFGHVAFFINFMWILLGGRAVNTQEGPTLIGALSGEKTSS
jgi:cytochrome c oxidase cbb3-type subunit I